MLDYMHLIDGQFISLALGEGATRFRGLSWPTAATDIDSLGEVVSAVSYEFNKSRVVLARLGSVIAMLVVQTGHFVARLAGRTEAELDDAERDLRDALPRSKPDPDRQEVTIGFWHADRQSGGGAPTYSRLAVPRWKEIQDNYDLATRRSLDGMMSNFRAGHGGRLLLWTGAPGTGKTYALRALAWEWRDWCSVHYITDPDAMFGAHGDYMMQMVMHRGQEKDWRLLVLEDTGELLAADAKARTGQGLSRLLNVVDGFIGQGFPTLILVTTNEVMSSLHPAIARPGRCASHIAFEPLSQADASAWLKARNVEAPIDAPHTIADLYALADGFGVAPRPRAPMGFGR